MQTSKTRATLRLIESLMPQHPREELWEGDPTMAYGTLRLDLPNTGAPTLLPCQCSRCCAARDVLVAHV